MIGVFVGFVVAFVVGGALVRPIRGMLARRGHVRANYAGRLVPTSSGVHVVASAAVACALAVAFGRAEPADTLPGLLVVVVASIVGLLDDLSGSARSKGILGHLRALVSEGRPTTGTLKAAVIWVAGAIATCHAPDGPSAAGVALGSVTISLSANFTNLLDLRPGRAAKAFFAGTCALLATARPHAGVVAMALAGAILSGLGDELKERSMMGDAGSNPLGAALGYWIALGTDLPAMVLATAFLMAVHIWTERHSITDLIERVPLLRLIDRLGRR